MSQGILDFAVFGSSPLAGLLAGLLASSHGKSVARIGDVAARYRLPRSIDMSVAPLTRPETWALLGATRPENERLLIGIGGRGALRRDDPIWFADAPYAREALGHVVHMARANGLAIQALPPSVLGADRMAYRISDTLSIYRPVVEARIESWLTELGVARFQSAALGKDESALIATDAGTIEARCAILVDDKAILSQLPARDWPGLLRRRTHATVLVASGRRLAAPVMQQLETGTVLVAHEEGGMAAFGPGKMSVFSARLAQLLAEGGQLQQVGQVGYDAVASVDGAPILGKVGPTGPVILANLGPVGAFLAPVLARWLVGQATEQEMQWCEARGADRTLKSSTVTEFSAYADCPL